MSSHDRHPLAAARDAVSGRPAGEILDEIASVSLAARTVVVLSHVNPDGDALGSQVALALGLGSLGKEVRVLCAREYPAKYAALLPDGIVEVASDAAGLQKADLCFLLDTGEPSRAGPFEGYLMAQGQRRACIDHHPVSGTASFDHVLIVPQAPATGCLVLSLLDRLGVGPTAAAWADISRALWIALATDTGWFRFANTTRWALEDAARLVTSGLDTEHLYRRIYEELTPARARVLGTVLAGVRTELGGRLVWSRLPWKAYADEGITVADLDGIVDHLKSVGGAEVIAFIVEVEGGLHKVSLRAPGSAEVESIARRFGGGGHAKAAGYRHRGPAGEIVSDLISAVARSLAERPGGQSAGT